MTADYSGGSISVFPIADGTLAPLLEQLKFEGSGPVSNRQESSHIHQLKVLPGRQGYILASDLGADVIRLIEVSCGHAGDDGIGLCHICDIPCPPGSGPRHMEFSIGPDGCLALQPARLQFESDMPSSIVAASR